MLGWSILRTGEGFSSAEAAFNKAIELEPSLSSPQKGRAYLLWLAGRADAAHTACEELLDRLVREGRDDPDSQVIRGWCLARLGRWQDAVVDYVRALPETRDDRAVIEFDLALCQLQVGRSDDAKGTLKQACSDLPPFRSQLSGRPDRG